MGLFNKLQLQGSPVIDWEMTPEYSFGTFESWGGKERVRSKKERVYYFFVDNWGDSPRLCLMERGIKHARVVAEILAPQDLIERCVARHGKTPLYEKSLAIDEGLKRWLLVNVIESEDESRILPIIEEHEDETLSTGLPGLGVEFPSVQAIRLPDSLTELTEEGVLDLIHRYGFFDSDRNPAGQFTNFLVDNGDGLTVTDRVTGLMWQRGGLDIMSFRMLQRDVEKLNGQGFAGFSDWRLPAMEEAMSLLEKEKNSKDQHVHPCFSRDQPFIFVAGLRKPGGYWFVDFKQGRAFWSSGTIPGGFGRLCRRVG